MKRLALAAALSCVPLVSHAALAPAERRLAQAVTKREPAAQAFLHRVVDINSGTMNFDGVREVAKAFAPEFEKLGFTTRWVDGAGWHRAGHLIATRAAAKRGAPQVLLIGHLDTVFEKDSPFQRMTPLTDSTATGPGLSDMKGGDVVVLLALQAMRDAGVLDRMTVTVFLCGDEEKRGEPEDLARGDLLAAARDADIALGFEDGDGDPGHAVIARRGSMGWTLRVHGTPSHSSQIFRADIGMGAVYEAARLLTAFRDSLGGDPLLTFNAGLILGGTTVTHDPQTSSGTAFGKTNVVPESTIVKGDLRAISPERFDEARATMTRIVAASSPHTSATIVFGDRYPPLAPTPGNDALRALYSAASRDLGYGEVAAMDPSRAGAADISYTAGLVGGAIDGIGMRGDQEHTVGEWANLRWLPRQAQRLAVTLTRWAAGRGR